MKEYLIKWQDRDGGPAEEEDVTESAVAERLQHHASLSAAALALYVRVPLEIKTSVRIIKRRKSTPAVQPEAGSPPASVGLPGRSTEEQLYRGDVPECLMEGCDKAGEMGDMCAAHYVAGISDKAKAMLRAKKNARQAPFIEKQNGAKRE